MDVKRREGPQTSGLNVSGLMFHNSAMENPIKPHMWVPNRAPASSTAEQQQDKHTPVLCS
jgi:hypothetical protein